MKRLLVIYLTNLLFVSCLNNLPPQDTVQCFPEYLFKIDCPCRLSKELNAPEDQYYVWRCNTNDEQAVYAISIKDLSEDLRKLEDSPSKEFYKSEFLEEYETNLMSTGTEFNRTKIYGFDALEYAITLGSLINKQAIFRASELVYTLSLISDTDRIDSLFKDFTDSFELYYQSAKYNYTIEIPKGFYSADIIGENVDFKYGNEKGNSIVIVVKELSHQERGMTVSDIYSFSDSFWESGLQLPNVQVKKKGKVTVDNRNGMFLHYTSKDDTESYTSYFTNYLFVYKGYFYTLTATCEDTQLAGMQATFFRALHSFKFPE